MRGGKIYVRDHAGYRAGIHMKEYKKKVPIMIIGGCAGNTMGISHLVKGMNVDDAIERMEGIRCGNKPTSCPDQLAKALRAAKEC